MKRIAEYALICLFVAVVVAPAALLSINILNFSVDTKIEPFAIIDRISTMASELNSYMEAKQEQFLAARGIVPGSPGANISGNMDPEAHIQLNNMTVREILNSVVLYSQNLYEETKSDQGYKTPPTSWIYQFVVDPDAKTGLGGTPYFTAF